MIRLVYHFKICNFYETTNMGKFIKRSLQLILGLIILILGVGFAYLNSEKFAVHKVALQCSSPTVTAKNIDMSDYPQRQLFGSLRKDYLNNKMLLNWVAEVDQSQNGLQQTRIMTENITYYQSTSFKGGLKTIRTINRNDLTYVKETTESSRDINIRVLRYCTEIPRSLFEQKRKEVADATKKKQKI